MKMRRSSIEYIIPGGLALAITIGLIYSIPALSTLYLLKLLRSEVVSTDFFRYYHDMNQDGRSEIIEVFYNSSGNLAVKLRRLNEVTINQFNLPGRLTSSGRTLFVQDINRDGITDIFICTEKNDSLYLTIIDDIFGRPTTSKVYTLDVINQFNDNGDYLFIPGGIRDLNGDGTPEFIMAVNGGHSLQPRRVYAIDYRNNSVMRSPISGAAVYSLDFFDLDGDGADEILLNTTATNNFSEPFPNMDTTSYLMVLDNDLSYYRPPVALSESFSTSSLTPFTYNAERFLLVCTRYIGGDNTFSLLAIYDDSLNPVKQRSLELPPRESIVILRDSDSLELKYMRILGKENRFGIDFELQFTDSMSSIVPVAEFNRSDLLLDLDGNGKDEYVFPGDKQIYVIGKNLTQMAVIDVQWSALNPRILISAIKNGSNAPILFVQIDSERFFISYSLNGWFKYREIVYPGIYLLLFGMFYILGNLQNRLIRRRYERERLINQLQLQSIKNQLDPHFTYNALNAVGSLIYKGEKELAYHYLKGFTDLLRLVSGDTSDVTWTLDDEFSFVRKFLEIEKLRFREKFVYAITVQDKLGEQKVPKLSVLTFVENAIKHGLRHKRNEKRLEIKAVAYKGGLQIGVADNGIGRIAAEKYRDEKSGNGIGMMTKYFKQFNEATGRKAWFEIDDLFNDDNEPAGTLVKIHIV